MVFNVVFGVRWGSLQELSSKHGTCKWNLPWDRTQLKPKSAVALYGGILGTRAWAGKLSALLCALDRLVSWFVRAELWTVVGLMWSEITSCPPSPVREKPQPFSPSLGPEQKPASGRSSSDSMDGVFFYVRLLFMDQNKLRTHHSWVAL